jgi:flagella basal body P-ring formation protein FlgA
MIRYALAILLITSGPACAQALDADTTGAGGAGGPQLRSSVTVIDDVVRIGDLITNAGDQSDVAIFRAPDLGTTGSVPAARVIDAARAHHILGVALHGVSDVVVTRASRSIAADAIEAQIAQAIAHRQGHDDAERVALTFDRDVSALQIEADTKAALRVTRLSYDSRSGRFDVLLDVPGSRILHRTPLRLTGQAAETIAVATLARPLARGDVIHASDIVVQRRPKYEVNANVVTGTKDLVGFAVRNAIPAGQMVQRAALMRPELVQRSQTVTIIFEVPGLTLTVRGKALESGAEGDLVLVQNVQSQRSVRGTVVGPGTVAVIGNRPHFAANTLTQTAVRDE